MAPGEGWASIGSQLFYIEMYIKKIFSKIIGPEKLKRVQNSKFNPRGTVGLQQGIKMKIYRKNSQKSHSQGPLNQRSLNIYGNFLRQCSVMYVILTGYQCNRKHFKKCSIISFTGNQCNRIYRQFKKKSKTAWLACSCNQFHLLLLNIGPQGKYICDLLFGYLKTNSFLYECVL